MGEPHKILAMIEDHVGSIEKNETAFLLTKAAACIREMVERNTSLGTRLDRAMTIIGSHYAAKAGLNETSPPPLSPAPGAEA